MAGGRATIWAKRALAGGFVASIVGAGVLWWRGPAIAEARAREWLAEHGASDIEIQGLGFGRAVQLAHLAFVRDAWSLACTEVSVSATGGPVGLALGGADAIDEVSIGACTITLDAAQSADEATGGGSDPEISRPVASSTLPRVTIAALTLSATDEAGELVHLQGAASLSDGRATLGEAEIVFGTEEADRFEMHGLDVVTVSDPSVDGGRWLVERASLEDLGVTTGSSAEREVLRERIRSAISAASGARVGVDDGREGGAGRGLLAPLFARFATDAVLTIDGGHLRTASGSELVHSITLRSTRAAAGGFTLDLLATSDDGRVRFTGTVGASAEVRLHVVADAFPLGAVVPFLPSLPWYEPERARVNADLQVERDPGAPWHIEGETRTWGLAFSHPTLATDPVRGIDFSLSGRAVFNRDERRLSLPEVAVRVEPLEVEGALEIELAPRSVLDEAPMLAAAGIAPAGSEGSESSENGEGVESEDAGQAAARVARHFRVSADLRLPRTRCADLTSAIPPDLLGDLDGFSLAGRIQGRMHLELDTRDIEATEFRVRVADGCEFLTVPVRADVRRFGSIFRHRVEEGEGRVFEMMAGPGSADWVDIGAISPFMVHAALGHEDGAFFRHGGFSRGAIRDAIVRNLREGRVVVGASTITMQLAKNLFLNRERTIARKVREVLLTWWLEKALSKEEILELYLNIIEYGPSVYGVVHAADYYFGVHPSELTAAQSAFLASVLPSPRTFHLSFERGELTQRMSGKIRRFLRHMHERHRFDAEALAHGLNEVEHFRFGASVPRPGPRGRTRALPLSASIVGFGADPALGEEGDEADEGADTPTDPLESDDRDTRGEDGAEDPS